MGRPAKVLVVDDAATFLQWAELVLSRAGYAVTTTDNPARVPRLVFSGDFDLLLLDVSMPLLDGDKVATILAGSAKRPTTVFFSSKADDELERLVAATQADGYIRKTREPGSFLRQVRSFLDGGGAASTLPDPA